MATALVASPALAQVTANGSRAAVVLPAARKCEVDRYVGVSHQTAALDYDRWCVARCRAAHQWPRHALVYSSGVHWRTEHPLRRADRHRSNARANLVPRQDRSATVGEIMIQSLLTWLGAPAQPAPPDPVDLFLAGHSIPSISAAAGRDIIAEQRRIEGQIRAYVLDLEAQIAELQAER
jgi:hypothetical protein